MSITDGARDFTEVSREALIQEYCKTQAVEPDELSAQLLVLESMRDTDGWMLIEAVAFDSSVNKIPCAEACKRQLWPFGPGCTHKKLIDPKEGFLSFNGMPSGAASLKMWCKV